MRKVLLTVVSAALMGASTLSGAVVPNAFAQTQASGTLADATALEQQALAACATDEAQFRTILGSYAALMAQLVASGALTEAEALDRFQALRDAARAADCGAVADDVFEELFPNTAAVTATDAPSPIQLNGPQGGGGAAPADIVSPN